MERYLRTNFEQRSNLTTASSRKRTSSSTMDPMDTGRNRLRDKAFDICAPDSCTFGRKFGRTRNENSKQIRKNKERFFDFYHKNSLKKKNKKFKLNGSKPVLNFKLTHHNFLRTRRARTTMADFIASVNSAIKQFLTHFTALNGKNRFRTVKKLTCEKSNGLL